MEKLPEQGFVLSRHPSIIKFFKENLHIDIKMRMSSYEHSKKYNGIVWKNYGKNFHAVVSKSAVKEYTEQEVLNFIGKNVVANTEKICFKSDGTKETGAKIIKALEELGGENNGWRCTDKNGYYGITINGYIEPLGDEKSKNYTLKDIHTWKQEPLSKEELLKEAKKKYPIGCVFNNTNVIGHKTENQEVIQEPYIAEDRTEIWTITRDSTWTLYSNGKWAEIVSQPQEQPSKDKPFYVVVTEENKEVLSKWVNRGNLWSKCVVGFKENKADNRISRAWSNGTTDNYKFTFGNEITFEQFLELYPECKEETAPENVIPEYVEHIKTYHSKEPIGKIYKTNEKPAFSDINDWREILIRFNNLKLGYYKPSTKEDYDAQQGVKEFILPEKWCVVRTPENCSPINKWFSDRHTSNFSSNGAWFNATIKDYMHFPFLGQKVYQDTIAEGYKEITFEQFKEHILKEKVEVKKEQWIPKVGDWVITKGYSKEYDGKPLKITNIYKSSDINYCNFKPSREPFYNFDIKHIIRKAEGHEVYQQENLKGLVEDYIPGQQSIVTGWRDKYVAGIEPIPQKTWLQSHEEQLYKHFQLDADKFIWGVNIHSSTLTDLEGIPRVQENILPKLELKNKKKLSLNNISKVQTVTSKLTNNNKKVKL